MELLKEILNPNKKRKQENVESLELTITEKQQRIERLTSRLKNKRKVQKFNSSNEVKVKSQKRLTPKELKLINSVTAEIKEMIEK